MNLNDARKSISEHVKDLIDQCPHCGAKSHIEAQWNECHKYRNGDAEFYVIFRCRPCRKLILKTLYFEQNRYSQQENLTMRGWKDTFPMILDEHLGPDEKEHVPTEVLEDYEEALRCKSVGADKASCAMFRRALQSALVLLGAKAKENLISQIDSLYSLPADIRDWSHQIRIFGNWGAHPDQDQLKNVDRDDVLEVHDFFSKFLVYTFIMPAKVRASRERREARTQPENDSGSEA
ncbi:MULTISPECIES: DUF4145 domain-containing protein [unclassified Wenzhouxiangella]|uniref:DUF4145 domain-containing protein n=1 Tax=unclassified Wenzhouxiangella TaxID=2613841 RepID=UPI000E3A2C9C|nr:MULTISPECIES: DUF4145 domain-containing protein [unclassified Wenzhouxiangella]RFF27200.1 DUF4145 domain-containing protein [Wenzhouxiangella sp. 15181]RFP69113.1 DUF4145 domain-containing protein [Wenzhouxiangella sp. 15190]